MPLVAGLDIGTSSTKIVVLDENGTIVRTASAAYESSFPQPGWSEQNPEDWANAAQSCLEQVADLTPFALGITGQMHGLTALDRFANPIRPAILWNDQRTAAECRLWEELIEKERLREICFNAPMTGFQVPKLLWLRNHEAKNYEKIHSCLLPKDYVAFRLTGVMASDASDAAGTGVFDVGTAKWSSESMSALELDDRWFPSICHRSVGRLASGGNVYLAGGDQSANGVGTGTINPSTRSLSLGSSAVLFSPASKPLLHPSETLNCFNHISGDWLVMGVSLNGTLALERFISEWLPGIAVNELAMLASQSPVGANGIRVFPYYFGERCPINDSSANPKVHGANPTTTQADLARGILEGIALNLAYANEYINDVAGTAQVVTISGGGSKNETWVQIFADLLEVPIQRLSTTEGPAFGAALIAGVREGIWSSINDAVLACRRIETVIDPSNDYSNIFHDWRRVLL